MNVSRLGLLFSMAALLACGLCAPAGAAASNAQRDATREQLRQTLTAAGAEAGVSIAFRQSTKNPYNFVGTTSVGLANADLLEVIVGISDQATIRLRVYPHYNGAYVNTKRVRDPDGLKDRLLLFNDRNFFFWGADDSSDVFSAFEFTLESGFPRESVLQVLRSIRNTDRFVGQLRPFIDGTSPR